LHKSIFPSAGEPPPATKEKTIGADGGQAPSVALAERRHETRARTILMPMPSHSVGRRDPLAYR